MTARFPLRDPRAIRWVGAVLGVALLCGAAWTAPPVRAQAPVTLVDSVESYFPDGLAFHFEVQTDQPIARLRLNYTVGRDGSTAYVYVPVADGPIATADYWLSTFGGAYIPPKAQITYWYQIEDAAGQIAETARQTVLYDDLAFDWQTTEGDGLTVYHHDIGADRAQDILEVGLETVAAARTAFGVDVTNPIAIVVYNDVAEMNRALPPQSQEVRDALVTLGQAHPDRDVVLVLDFYGNDRLLFETTRHELQHVITSQATKNPYSQLPVWLNEGLSVFVEGNRPVEYLAHFSRSQRNGSVLYLRDLTRRPADPDEQLLVYGEGYLMVEYLHNRYGAASIRSLLDAYNAGRSTDQAFVQVYGKTLDQMDTDWRATVGLPPVPPRSGPLPSATPIAVPTVVPLGS